MGLIEALAMLVIFWLGILVGSNIGDTCFTQTHVETSYPGVVLCPAPHHANNGNGGRCVDASKQKT
jgi:hypothetical protein